MLTWNELKILVDSELEKLNKSGDAEVAYIDIRSFAGLPNGLIVRNTVKRNQIIEIFIASVKD